MREEALRGSGAASHHVRVYYFGGDGPHYGARNSSLGLATMEPDRYVGIGGSGRISPTDRRVLCTGRRLLVTVDVLATGGGARVGVGGVAGLGAAHAAPITRSGRRAVVEFAGGADLGALVGTGVAIEAMLDRAVLYTVGFDGGPPAEPPPASPTIVFSISSMLLMLAFIVAIPAARARGRPVCSPIYACAGAVRAAGRAWRRRRGAYTERVAMVELPSTDAT